MRWPAFRLSKRGFSLVETMMVLFVSSFVIGGLYSVFVSQQNTYGAQERIAEMNQNIRAAMDLMTREIRLAGYKTSTATFSGIATAQVNTIRLLVDLNQDGSTLDDKEDITYSYNGGTLQICRNGVDLPIAENITDLRFIYTLADGTTTSSPANPADIRKVTVSITARSAYPDPNTGSYQNMTLVSDVALRNLAS